MFPPGSCHRNTPPPSTEPMIENNGRDTNNVELEKEHNQQKTTNEDKVVTVPEPLSCEKGASAAQIDGVETLGDNINDILNDDDDVGIGGDDRIEEDHEEMLLDDDEDPEEVMNRDENNEDDKDHPLMAIDSVFSDKKKGKNLEVFVSRFDKKIVEEDLIEVFEKFGEIKSARVVRNKTTNKSKGFAFIQYASNEQAESAISASEGGIEVKGKQVKVSMSNDNNTTLYLGNICRSWTKERVLETLKNIGVENVEDMRIPGAQKEGRTRGFAFLEFDTHFDAMLAFERLSKPDAIFGRDGNVKVSFSQTFLHPHEEVIPQVKTIYVEGLPDDWTEAKVKEFCEQYGKVEEIRLSRRLGKKRKDYGHIDFAARESALACLEGFKNACIEGVSTVKASIAKPLLKGWPQKHVPREGFKVEKGEVSTIEEESKRENRGASSNLNGRANSKRSKRKGKMPAEGMRMTQVVAEAGGSGKSNENQAVSKTHLAQASTKSEKARGKRKNLHMKAESRGPRGMSGSGRGPKGKTSEKAQGKNQRNQNTSFGKRKGDTRASKGSNPNADFGTYRSQYASGHVPVRFKGHSYNTIAGSKRPYTDMEPHSGYLEPVARKQGRVHSGQYEPPGAVHYSPHARIMYQPHGGHLQSEVGTYHQARANFQPPPAQVRYVDPVLRTDAQPHAGYLQPAVGNRGYDLRGTTIGRGGRQDLYETIPSAYRAASSIVPSYPQHYTSRVGYEAGSSGGGYYQSSGVQSPHKRPYY